MKAISLWQPWASAMALGSKLIETRHWSTDVRGQVAIHAAKRRVKSELEYLGCCVEWKGALAQYRHHDFDDYTFLLDLPFGAIVAVGCLSYIMPTEQILRELDVEVNRFVEKAIVPNPMERATLRWTEKQMGDYSPGRFGWVFTDIEPLTKPVPFTGRQGWFDVPDELLTEVQQ